MMECADQVVEESNYEQDEDVRHFCALAFNITNPLAYRCLFVFCSAFLFPFKQGHRVHVLFYVS